MFAYIARPINRARRTLTSLLSTGVLLFASESLPQPNAPDHPVIDLSLGQAIEMAISPRGDASVRLAKESEQLAIAKSNEARARLLPSLEGSVAEQNQTVNPQALGLRFAGSLLQVPKEVGPFSTFDARLRLNQNVFNLSAVRHWQAERKDRQAAQSEIESVRELVAATVARYYAAALRAGAQVEVSKTNIAASESLRDLASHRASTGEGTDLETARANLGVARDKQKLIAAEANHTRTLLGLVKILKLDWNTTLHLTGKLDGLQGATPTLSESLSTALKSRAGFKAFESRIESARLSAVAARGERLPSIVVYADYGALEGAQTHTVGAALRVSLFDGGRIRSDELQAMSFMQQEKIREDELKRQVELEVRQALTSLESAEQQVQVAGQAIALAEEELARARRRYEAGLTNSFEVVDAKTQVGVAAFDRVEALFDYVSARIDLAQATGTITKLVF